jgi:hypothetical protein
MRSQLRLDDSGRRYAGGLRLRLPRRLTVTGAVAISALFAFVIALNSVCAISLLPPKLEPRPLQVAGATANVLVDAPRSWILDPKSLGNDFIGLADRGEMLANLLASPALVRTMAQRMGIAPGDIAATLRLTSGTPPVMRDPDSEQRASAIVDARDDYRLDLQADPDAPVLHIYTQAPTRAEAVTLADVSVDVLRKRVASLAVADAAPLRKRMKLTQLGPARGGVIGGSVGQVAGLMFVIAFSLGLAVLLLGQRALYGWRAHRDGTPAATVRAPQAPPRAAAPGGDWPRTGRVLPWMLAAFMAMIWLVPFNTIELTASLPFDLKLDRLVLPFVLGLWILALAAGGAAAPRPRATWIHFGIGAFVGTACLSVAADVLFLNHTLELPLAIKKIILLVSYLGLFVVVASAVRRTEVPAFMKYTLGLAILCALGTIWEYRFGYNVFYSLSDQILPGIFKVGAAEAGTFDAQGRALTRGPAEHPLEAVAMLTMALPIALVGLIHAKERSATIVYGIAACIILAASVSTYRKSALLAPLSVGLTLAYFRRRELLRLTPLAVVAVFFVSFLSPGALRSIAEQLAPTQLGVGTVSDRASDYDAVRPDVWSHLILGRGFGSYDHVSYRLLDSEILGRLVDMGLLGLLSLGLMIVMIVGTARALIRSRHPVWSPTALAVAAAAIAYLVVAFLFDVSSFPHTPYVLMTLAGFLAVVVAGSDEPAVNPPPPAAVGAVRDALAPAHGPAGDYERLPVVARR